MVDEARALRCLLERSEIAKIAGDEFYGKPVEVIATAGGSNETANLFAAFEKGSNEMRSDESGSTCD